MSPRPDGAPVGDDGDGVLLDRQRPHRARVLGDGAGHACDTGGVRHRQVVARLDRQLRDNLELAAEVEQVEQERAVRDVLHENAVEVADRLDDARDVVRVRRENGYIASGARARITAPFPQSHAPSAVCAWTGRR
jgi:predicted ATPase with chaperone activity